MPCFVVTQQALVGLHEGGLAVLEVFALRSVGVQVVPRLVVFLGDLGLSDGLDVHFVIGSSVSLND